MTNVSTGLATTEDHTYPRPRPVDDPAFTLGLVLDVAAVLEARGYPPVTTGADLLRLQQSLFDFIYGSQS